MAQPKKSILVVSTEPSVAQDIGAALPSDAGVKIDSQSSTLSQMNGQAVKMAADYDMVLFQTSPEDNEDIEAIKALVTTATDRPVLLALADGNISLAQSRALNRAGVDDVLPIALIAEEICDKVSRLETAPLPTAAAQAQVGKVIAVAQSRGGAGSTTVAVNLADQLAGRVKKKRGEIPSKVAIVDFDLQFGTVGSFLDLEEQDTLLQMALDGTVPDATFLEQSMVTMPNGLSVLAAPSKFAPLDSLRIDQVAAILDTLRASHDYVVVDLPRAMVSWLEAVIQRTDELLVVTNVSVSSIRHCRRVIDFFTADNVTLPVKIVVNGEKKPMLQSSLHREAAKALERKLDYWLPHDPRAANAASDRGQPLSHAAPRSPLNKAMARMIKDTLALSPHIPKGRKGRRV